MRFPLLYSYVVPGAWRFYSGNKLIEPGPATVLSILDVNSFNSYHKPGVKYFIASPYRWRMRKVTWCARSQSTNKRQRQDLNSGSLTCLPGDWLSLGSAQELLCLECFPCFSSSFEPDLRGHPPPRVCLTPPPSPLKSDAGYKMKEGENLSWRRKAGF